MYASSSVRCRNGRLEISILSPITQRLLSSTITTATTLAAVLVDLYDTDSLYWEPEVIRAELTRLAGRDVPEINVDKINALTSALTNDSFFSDFYVFSHVCNALGGLDSQVLFSVFDPPSPEEMAWSIFEVNLNDTSEKIADRLHPDVKTFIGLLLRESGLSQPPRVLNFIKIPGDNSPDIFADDPDIYLGYTKLLSENKAAVDAYVEARASQLLSELKNVKFENGDVAQVLERLNKK